MLFLEKQKKRVQTFPAVGGTFISEPLHITFSLYLTCQFKVLDFPHVGFQLYTCL